MWEDEDLDYLSRLSDELSKSLVNIKKQDMSVQQDFDAMEEYIMKLSKAFRRNETQDSLDETEMNSIRESFDNIFKAADAKIQEADQMIEYVNRCGRDLKTKINKFKLKLEAKNAVENNIRQQIQSDSETTSSSDMDANGPVRIREIKLLKSSFAEVPKKPKKKVTFSKFDMNEDSSSIDSSYFDERMRAERKRCLKLEKRRGSLSAFGAPEEKRQAVSDNTTSQPRREQTTPDVVNYGSGSSSLHELFGSIGLSAPRELSTTGDANAATQAIMKSDTASIGACSSNKRRFPMNPKCTTFKKLKLTSASSSSSDNDDEMIVDLASHKERTNDANKPRYC